MKFTEEYCNSVINSLPNPYNRKVGSPIISHILQYVNNSTPYSFVCFSSKTKTFVHKIYKGKNAAERFLLEIMLRLNLDLETIQQRIKYDIVDSKNN